MVRMKMRCGMQLIENTVLNAGDLGNPLCNFVEDNEKSSDIQRSSVISRLSNFDTKCGLLFLQANCTNSSLFRHIFFISGPL